MPALGREPRRGFHWAQEVAPENTELKIQHHIEEGAAFFAAELDRRHHESVDSSLGIRAAARVLMVCAGVSSRSVTSSLGSVCRVALDLLRAPRA